MHGLEVFMEDLTDFCVLHTLIFVRTPVCSHVNVCAARTYMAEPAVTGGFGVQTSISTFREKLPRGINTCMA